MRDSASSSISPRALKVRKPPPYASPSAAWHLRDELHDPALRGASLRPVLADLFKERAVGAEIEDGVSRTAVDMPPPEEIGDHEKIIGLPLEPPAGELGRAFAIKHNVEGVRGFALPRSEEHTSELQSLTNLVC